MIEVAKLWSWISDKIKKSESSRKIGPPYRELPQIPVPKTRTKPKYTLVLIGESGNSRQLELSSFHLRLGLGIIAVVIVITGALTVNGLLSKKTANIPDPKLVAKIEALQEETKQKEADILILEKRVKELEEIPPVTALSQRTMPELHKPFADPEETLQGSAAGRPDSLKKQAQQSKPLDLEESFNSGLTGSSVSEKPAKSVETNETVQSMKQTPLNFNAQDVVATSDATNNGTLSFRLVKDQPDVRFAGYLFVFVEMQDGRGENKIYVYPKAARLGDEDLPADYREGEALSFKYNSRVELPFGDIRSGASLSRVSILLYGENGKIVFQRGFEKKELKQVTAKPAPVEGPKAKAPDKRKAL